MLGEQHPGTAASLNNLGLACYAQSRYGEAEDCYQRAFAIRLKVLGEQHPDTIRVLIDLADLFHRCGRLADALPLYQRALNIVGAKNNYFHSADPYWHTLLDGYAQALYRLGNIKNAEDLWQRLKDIRADR